MRKHMEDICLTYFIYNNNLTYDPVRRIQEDRCLFQGYLWSVLGVSGKILSEPDLPR